MKLGVIGTGSIASAVVRGLAGKGHEIVVSERSRARSAGLAAEIAEVRVDSNQQVVDASDVLFLGLIAEHAPEVLGALRFREGQKVISLMATAGLDQVAGWVAPAEAEAMMIPFPGIAQGGSPIMLRGGSSVVNALFAADNRIFELQSERELAAYMAAQAVLSPAAKLVKDAADWMGQRVSDPSEAEAFLRFLVGSSLLGSESGALIAALDTPGGYNQRLREHMVAAGMSSDLVEGLDKLAKG